MERPFIYRLEARSSKNGKNREQHLIPIYAFKAGDVTSLFINQKLDLPLLQMITTMADGARMLTVCTNTIYANRALAEKDVEYFQLYIQDSAYPRNPMDNRRTLATITCKDMTGGKNFPVASNLIKMSSEPLSNELKMITLSFFDYDGGPVFQRV